MQTLKPCHSPYCECTPHKCSHPGFYDARHLPFEFPQMNYHVTNTDNPVDFPRPTIKQTHQIAYNYCMANIQQRAGEAALGTALQSLGSDNQIFGLAEPIEGAYTELVAELLGPELFDWLMWWMYEADMGTNMGFSINGTEYNTADMTLYRFLEIVDAQ